MNTDNAKALRVGFRLPSMLRRFYDQLVCSASWKREDQFLTHFFSQTRRRFRNSSGKEFFLAWYDFPKFGNNHNLPYGNQMKQNFICMSLSNVSSGYMKNRIQWISQIPSGYVQSRDFRNVMCQPLTQWLEPVSTLNDL